MKSPFDFSSEDPPSGSGPKKKVKKEEPLELPEDDLPPRRFRRRMDEDAPRSRDRETSRSRKLAWVIGLPVTLILVGVAAYFLLRKGGTLNETRDWKEFVSSDGNYRVQLPASAKKQTTPLNTKAGPTQLISYEATLDGIQYTVSHTDYPAGHVGMSVNYKFTGGRDHRVHELGGTEVQERSDLSFGYPGREYEMRTAKPDGHAVVRLCVARDKVYELVVVGPQPDIVRSQANKLFASFQLAYPLVFDGHLVPFLAAAIDSGNALLITTPEGKLEHYSYPIIKHQASYDLGRVGTHIALDAKKGLLFVTTCAPQQLPKRIHGPEWSQLGNAELAVYDVSGILAGNPPKNRKLVPRQSSELNAKVGKLALSPGGEWLYCHTIGGKRELRSGSTIQQLPADVQLVRIDVASLENRKAVLLADGTDAVCLSASGDSIFATASPLGHDFYAPNRKLIGKVQVIDAKTMELTDIFDVEADPFSIAASAQGLLYMVGGSNQWTDLSVVDVKARRIIARWPQIYMETPVGITPDGNWLLLSQSASPGSVQIYSLKGDPARPVMHVDQLTEIEGFPIGGEFVITPDNRFMLSRKGGVVRIPQP